jgi:hypothetical protein
LLQQNQAYVNELNQLFAAQSQQQQALFSQLLKAFNEATQQPTAPTFDFRYATIGIFIEESNAEINFTQNNKGPGIVQD